MRISDWSSDVCSSDLGGGLSGLAAAYYYRKQAGPKAKILILDNLQGIGGHAQRNEFEFEGRRFYAIAGSAYLVAPSTWSHEATSILDDLDVLHRNDPLHTTASDLYNSHNIDRRRIV